MPAKIRLRVNNVTVELRLRQWARWKTVRYEVFLAERTWSSGMIWRSGRRWLSTVARGPADYPSRSAALRFLVAQGFARTSEAGSLTPKKISSEQRGVHSVRASAPALDAERQRRLEEARILQPVYMPGPSVRTVSGGRFESNRRKH